MLILTCVTYDCKVRKFNYKKKCIIKIIQF